ncbi:TPM domain-containing protein [Paenibacillus caseinilyticus]|uniref:TPM domain-containing protein n=1 Tax=Paenibacillus caseinilyticus TaxID=3098138 RepID=UPI0022B8A46C|nr:TPM domain-containing protein [Paenibacillus caseinilyticus]MCZ8518646.1 TPM domain-containing protein [Paenibacillus caseinilyticus]
MKKIAIFTLSLLLLLGPSVSASSVPPMNGHVQDTAGMLPGRSLSELERTAEGPYTFHVLTVSSLEGQEPEAYAASVYRTWNLQRQDVLVLLSESDRRIEVQFNNPALQHRLDALPADYDRDGKRESAIDEWVGAHFMPYAQQGDFAGGLLHLMQSGQQLAAGPPGAAGASGGFSGASAGAGTGLGALLAGGVAVLLAVLLVRTFLRRRKLAALQEEQTGAAKKLVVEISRTQEALTPIRDLYPGERTSESADELEDGLTALSAEVQEALERILGYAIPLFGASTAGRDLEAFRAELAAFRTRFEEARRQVDHLAGLDRSISEDIGRLLEKVAAAETQAAELSARHALPMDELKAGLAGMREGLNRSAALQVSDLLAAEGEVLPLQEKLAVIRSGLDKLPHHVEELEALPSRIAAVRGEIRWELEAAGLRPAEAWDPEAPIAEAEQTGAAMQQALERGLLAEAESASAAIAGLLEQARGEAARRTALRDGVKGDLAKIGAALDAYAAAERAYPQERTRAQAEFAEKHWSASEGSFRALKAAADGLRQGLEALKPLAGPETQAYTEARRLADGLLGQLQNAEALLADVRCVYAAPSRRLQELRDEEAQAWSLVRSGTALAEARSLPLHAQGSRQLAELERGLHGQKRQLDAALAAPPYDLDELGSLIARLSTDARAYHASITRMAEEKEQAERMLREVHARYQAVALQSGSRLAHTGYTRSYASNMSEIQNLLLLGLYGDALQRLTAADQAVSQLGMAYQAMLQEEQRQHLQRQRSADYSGGWGGAPRPSSGGGSWSGGSRSSGGGSWGGGRNSSGGGGW